VVRGRISRRRGGRKDMRGEGEDLRGIRMGRGRFIGRKRMQREGGGRRDKF